MILESIHNRLHFRPISEDDLPVLQLIYYSSRQSEMELLVDWSEEQKWGFIQQQFSAQHSYYQQHYPKAFFGLILWDENTVGRLYLMDNKEDVRIIDIALLPEFRNQGIGSLILHHLQKKAAAEIKSISIHVESFNPAMQWYERLGFTKVEDRGVYQFMKWNP